MIERGRGWIRDIDQRNTGALALSSNIGLLPATNTRLVPFADTVLDQSITLSCVAHAIVMAIYVYLNSKRQPGDPLVTRASVRAAYLMARRWYSRDPLRDVGCYPRDAIAASAAWGIIPEADAPFDPAKINDELDVDEIQKAAAYCVKDWRRVVPTGQDRVTETMLLLNDGYPCIFGLDTDVGFDRYNYGVYERLDSNGSKGDHMVLLLGYERLPGSAEADFIGLNSWSRSWGEGGFFRIGARTIASDHVNDIHALRGAPVFAMAA